MKSFNTIKNEFKNYLRLYKELYKDQRTPRISKIFLWLALGYLMMPIDLIPDFIPVIGQIDDLIIVPGLIFLALKFIPKSLYDEHYKEIEKQHH